MKHRMHPVKQNARVWENVSISVKRQFYIIDMQAVVTDSLASIKDSIID